MTSLRDVPIREQTIRLGQLLKLAGLAESGQRGARSRARRSVTVNGEIDTRRGRQLRRGDVVAVGREVARVA